MPEVNLEMIYRILQNLQARMTNLEDGQVRIEQRLTTLEQMFGSFISAAATDRDAIDQLKRRVERIERRLDLADSQ